MLRQNLTEAFKLPPAAVDWLCTLFDVIQAFDDLHDKDKPVGHKELDALIWSTLVSLPQNQFFRVNQDALWPLVANAILKWHGANACESSHNANAMSFAWRAGYYDIVLMVVGVVHGHQYAAENASSVMALYGETFNEYLREFDHA